MGNRRGPVPPAHLSPEAKKWWREVVGAYDLEAHHLKLLQAACEAWDRMQEARLRIADEGAYCLDRWGVPKAHPAVAVERDAKTTFARLLRELALDVEAPGESRPPGIGANAGLHLRG